MVLRASEYSRPRHFLVHISDTHFVPPGQLLGDVVDSRGHLAELLEALEAAHVHPAAIIFTGDLADRGEADAYRSLRDLVEPVAARLGARVIWAAGNHDDRTRMRTELLAVPSSMEPYDHVVHIGGLRIVVLDTSVPGWHYGEIEPAQLEWLRGVLAVPAPQGTVLALHHPPVPCVQDLAVSVELRDQGALADVLRGSDVRTILGGHLHYSTAGTFAGISVSVAASSCYTQDLLTPEWGTRGRDGAQGFNLVHVYDDTVVHSVVPIGTYPTVGRYVDAAETALLLAQAGHYIPEPGERVGS